MQIKVCPLILRQSTSSASLRDEILLFRHPNHSIQLVKGTVEANEAIVLACQRELQEESGLDVAPTTFKFLFEQDFMAHQQHWHVYYADIQEHRDDWSWQTLDDYGHRFDFFWCPLNEFSQKILTWEIDQRFIDVVNALIENLNNKDR